MEERQREEKGKRRTQREVEVKERERQGLTFTDNTDSMFHILDENCVLRT